ncbi:MAG: sodium:alanine symporter family protein [Firmicutes bacterium]|nr:sodium:alanine symporter family protein [Bacillota bacterium]
MIEFVSELNEKLNSFIWGPFMCGFFVFVGIYFSFRMKFFQLFKLKFWWKNTIGSMTGEEKAKKVEDKNSISSFQAMTTALAATMGTGNIVGVATAVVAGGPGAVFWMWISAIFGMMTKYVEIFLSIKYRRKNEKGEWIGGPMVFIEKGLNMKWLSVAFSVLCILASFGMGNMSQANSAAEALKSVFGIGGGTTGVTMAVITSAVIAGGIKRIGRVTEAVIPVIAVLYTAGGILLIIMNFRNVPYAFESIFKGAFGIEAASGGILGYTVSKAIRFGVARGVFSNEAGLGSSAMAYAAAETSEIPRQSMWGIFEVFADTIVMCTVTALAILTSGVLGVKDVNGNFVDGAELTIMAFSESFGNFAGVFVCIGIVLFSFSTLVGWSYYGEKCVEYLFGLKGVKWYRVLFIIFIVTGCVLPLKLIWEVSDTFNGMMAVPNLVAVLVLGGEVVKETKKYFVRKHVQK